MQREYKVHHVPNELFGEASWKRRDELAQFVRDNRAKYTLVATVKNVEGLDLDKVYERTNSIHQFWGENEDVVMHNGVRHRSTSVGDVIGTEVNGIFLEWIVAPVGFERIL